MWRNVHLEAFCCKCSAIEKNELTKIILFFHFWRILKNQKGLSGYLSYFARNVLFSVRHDVHRKMHFFYTIFLIHYEIREGMYAFLLFILDFITYDFFLCSII